MHLLFNKVPNAALIKAKAVLIKSSPGTGNDFVQARNLLEPGSLG